MEELIRLIEICSFAGILGGAACLIIAFSEKKYDRPKIMIVGTCLLLLGIISVISWRQGTYKLFLFSTFFFIGVAVILSGAVTLFQIRKCTYAIEAKFCERVHSYRSYIPVFSFRYKGLVIEAKSLVAYSVYEIDKKFKLGEMYEIYVDPDKPTHCIDKRADTAMRIVSVVLGAFLVLIAVSLLILPISIT